MPSGRKPGGKNPKALMRMEAAIRMEFTNLGLTDAQIAFNIGLTPSGYAQMKLRPEYKRLRDQITTGVVGFLDQEMYGDIKFQRQYIRRLVPVALEGLAQAALQRNNAKLRLDACREILDRDGNFAKVSRIGLPSEDQGGVASAKDNEIAAALVGALRSVASEQKSAEESKTPDINSAPPTTSVQ